LAELLSLFFDIEINPKKTFAQLFFFTVGVFKHLVFPSWGFRLEFEAKNSLPKIIQEDSSILTAVFVLIPAFALLPFDPLWYTVGKYPNLGLASGKS